MPKMSQAAVENYRPDKKKRREIRDNLGPGLYLVIQPQPSGKKSWAMRFKGADGHNKKLTLGPVDLSNGRDTLEAPQIGQALTLVEARILSNNLDRQRVAGKDIMALTRRVAKGETETYPALVREYIDDEVRSKNRTWHTTARMLGLEYPEDGSEPEIVKRGLCDRWKSRLASDITDLDIHSAVMEARNSGIPGMTARTKGKSDSRAREMACALGKMFRWARGLKKIPSNPALDQWRPEPLKARERALSRDEKSCEVRWFWKACGQINPTFAGCLRLLLLTGQRRDEVAGMLRSEFEDGDFAVWTVPASRSKNKRPNRITLPPMAREIVKELTEGKKHDHVFTTTGTTAISGFSKMKIELDTAMLELAREEAKEAGRDPDKVEIAPWHLHDLRRTASTLMHEIGILPHIIEAILNHRSGHKAGVAGVYNLAEYQKEKREALERWASFVQAVVEPTENVISMDAWRAQ